MTPLIDQIHAEFRAQADPKHREQLVWFFKKQKVTPLGVRSKEMNRIVARFWRDIKQWDKADIFGFCNQLWKTGLLEDGHLACKFAYRIGKRLEAEDFPILSTWLHTTINNWAHCDDLCTKALGEILNRYPETIAQTKTWHESENRWGRRGLAVSMLPSIKHGENIDHAFDIADRLLMDSDDLVQKGYGWMLKVTSQQSPEAVYNYILERRDRIPRTALRYAIEKLPDDMRREAMKKP